jgi:hypothetical protein
VKVLRLSAEARRRLAARRTRVSRLGYTERGWEAWLRGGQPNLSLTFAREAALDERSLAFITPVHPLIQTAAQALAKDEEICIALAVSSADHPAGTHLFALYRWSLTAKNCGQCRIRGPPSSSCLSVPWIVHLARLVGGSSS